MICWHTPSTPLHDHRGHLRITYGVVCPYPTQPHQAEYVGWWASEIHSGTRKFPLSRTAEYPERLATTMPAISEIGR